MPPNDSNLFIIVKRIINHNISLALVLYLNSNVGCTPLTWIPNYRLCAVDF